MPDIEQRLGLLLQEAAPEPDRVIRADAVRRRAGRQRRLLALQSTGVAATVALAILLPTVVFGGSPAPGPADGAAVTVTPGSGLHNGDTVQVDVRGFDPESKVRLSECATASAASARGCGSQIATQPFGVTTLDGSGSFPFVVTSRAYTQPFDTADRRRCASQCVIVVAGASASDPSRSAFAVAPLGFGGAGQFATNAGPLLGTDSTGQLTLWRGPGRATTVRLSPAAASPPLVATDPAGGWIVTYQFDASGRNRFVHVDRNGTAHAFGGVLPGRITGLDVDLTGSRPVVGVAIGNGARIEMVPGPAVTGRWHVQRSWRLPRDINDVASLSFHFGGLYYLAGINTGAGMGGSLSMLDLASTRTTAPASTEPLPKGCLLDAAASLANFPWFATVQECPNGAHPVYSLFDPSTNGKVAGTRALSIPVSTGCVDTAIHPYADGSRVLITACGHVYLVAGGVVRPVDTNLVAAAPAWRLDTAN